MSTVLCPSPRVKSIRPPQHPQHRQRKPLPPVAVTGSFGEGTTRAELFQGVAVLEVLRPEDSDYYWCSYVVDAGHIIGIQLRKFGVGTVYFLPADLSDCDCPDSTFWQRRCKHAAALEQALLKVVE
jgi:hypothetical protein